MRYKPCLLLILQVIAGSCDLSAPVPVNSEVAVPFESPLMTGHFILQIR